MMIDYRLGGWGSKWLKYWLRNIRMAPSLYFKRGVDDLLNFEYMGSILSVWKLRDAIFGFLVKKGIQFWFPKRAVFFLCQDVFCLLEGTLSFLSSPFSPVLNVCLSDSHTTLSMNVHEKNERKGYFLLSFFILMLYLNCHTMTAPSFL